MVMAAALLPIAFIDILLRSFLGGIALPGVLSPSERHQPQEQEHYIPAVHLREYLPLLDPALR